MLKQRGALCALIAATIAVGAGSAVADAAPRTQLYRNCPKVTKKVYPAPANLVSSHCKDGTYYERLRLADSSSTMSPAGEVTTFTRVYQKTVTRGPARGGSAAAKPRPAVV